MKTVKMIIKGILVWFTTLMAILFISGIDSIMDNYGAFGTVVSMIMIMAFISMCYAVVSYDDLKVVTGYNTFNNMLGIEDEEEE